MEGIIQFPKRGWLGQINCAEVRKACIEACLDAMIENRRFDYTDLFVRKS